MDNGRDEIHQGEDLIRQAKLEEQKAMEAQQAYNEHMHMSNTMAQSAAMSLQDVQSYRQDVMTASSEETRLLAQLDQVRAARQRYENMIQQAEREVEQFKQRSNQSDTLALQEREKWHKHQRTAQDLETRGEDLKRRGMSKSVYAQNNY